MNQLVHLIKFILIYFSFDFVFIIYFFRSFEEERCLHLIKESIKSGLNYMETAPWYGQGSSETTFGKVRA